MDKLNILNHVKRVAKDDLRIWASPFVAVVRAAKAELKRPPIPSTTKKFNHNASK
jgi:hypothetical protein